MERRKSRNRIKFLYPIKVYTGMEQLVGEDCFLLIFNFLNGIEISNLKRVSTFFQVLISKNENFIFENVFKNELKLFFVKEHFIQHLVSSLSSTKRDNQEEEEEKFIPISNFLFLYKKYNKFQKWKNNETKQLLMEHSKEFTTNIQILPKFSTNNKKNRLEKFTPEELEMTEILTSKDSYIVHSSLFSNEFDIVSLSNQKLIQQFSGHKSGVIDVIPLFQNPFNDILFTQKNNDNMKIVDMRSSLFNNRIISSSTDLTIKVWSLHNGKCLSTLDANHSAYTLQHCLNQTCLIVCLFSIQLLRVGGKIPFLINF
jgi:WD40 repeat protein